MLSSIAKELSKGGGTLALVHGNADSDALASAFAVQRSFPGVVVGVPGGLDRVAKLLAKELGIETVEDVSGLKADRLLILDTSGPEQLEGEFDFSKAFVVDHHTRNEKWSAAAMYYCDDSKSSCSEIVFELLKMEGREVTKDVALALMFGMLTDTGYFKFAKPATLTAFSELMALHGTQMDEVMGLVDAEEDISERVSQLKGAQRLKYWKVGNYIVAVSRGSAFEASVCKSLLDLGADIAFVGSQRGDSFRISGRATQAVVRRGVHLGKLLGDVGAETTNGGGGHPGAAGISGKGDVEAILNICVDNSLRLLSKILSSGDR
ncbi:MAG: DHH family phosphoesterase [Candidatus Thermoplasmatota archaeon]|nr:DHH family phosphoesterase [Candidatus Thermoplasmatota archaeon]